ncbi:glycosyltransferase 87 family protein [Streptantibioticus parmotrematis]|uniref:glycosyltransferase 87 family protein n=1 Tax=Streptantibioticus parmotrematis TaxID=2873249 RepID=UPI003F4CFBAF
MTASQPIAEGRPRGGIRGPVARRSTALAAVVCLVSFTGFWIAQRAANVSMIDLMVYRAEGWTIRTGGDLYTMVATQAKLPTTYPPFGAMIFTPLTWLGVPAMRTVATAANLVLLLVVVHLSLRLVGRPHRIPHAAATFAVSAGAVWCEPVWTTLRYGQINLLLAVLVLWDLTRRSGHRWAGIGIGVAAGIKLTPALFAVFLALVGLVQGWRGLRAGRRVWNPALRRACVAAAAFAVTAGTAALVLPRDSHNFWTRMIFEANRVGHVEDTANQSVRGVVARVLHSTDPGRSWLLSAAAIGLLGLAVAVAAALAGDRLPSGSAWAACACAATALLVSPISWSHHWVWCVPMVLLLASEALRRGQLRWRIGAGAAGLVFCSYVIWAVPHGLGRPELRQNAGQMLLSAAYPAVGLAFLALTGVQAVRALRRPPGRPLGGANRTPRTGDYAYAADR